jgi:AAA15 family ATPase/GTPase
LFNHDALRTATSLQTIPSELIETFEKKRDLKTLFQAEMNLSTNLFILANYFRETYRRIIDFYRKVFPFVQAARMTSLSELQPNISVSGHIPIFTVQERGSSRWIPVHEFSSGMQKVLLILTDIFIVPEGGIYMIDEYENSLGINAIDFFPQFILELEKDIQFFLTSHHPYIINEIPSSNWYIFHRSGMRVSIMQGEEIAERFGKSKQQAFVQLINDPFYSKGVR